MKAFLAGAFTFVVLFAAPAAANAVAIAVNTTADEYGTGTDCSLREAIEAANGNASFGGCPAGFGDDAISLPDGTYRITRAGAEEDDNATGDFDVKGADALHIQPVDSKAHVVIDGNGIDRVFDKTSTGNLKLTSLRITGGALTQIEDGGGIRIGVGLTELEDVTVDGNSSAYSAGGIAVYAQLQMLNSTISGNSSGGNGGGIYVPGGATATARSSTIYGNRADSDGDGNGYGGGFALAGGTSVNFTNVLNVKNSGVSSVPGNDAYDCYSGPSYYPRYTIQTQSIGPNDCLVGFNESSTSVSDPKVDPTLAYNDGGQTPTHDLLAGSPAIGAGGTAAPDECPGTDQNGVTRPAGACDVGAVQYVPTPQTVIVKITKILPKKKVIRRKKNKVMTLAVMNAGTGPAAGVKACLALPRAAKKGLRIKGKACKDLGAMPANGVRQAKVRLVAKPKAKKKAYVVRASARAAGASPQLTTFKVRVR